MPYTPFHADWKDYPDETTPITAEALEHIETGVTDAFAEAEAATAAADAAQTDIDNHLADASDAHDASAISVADSGGYFTGTDVEAALQELGAGGGGGATAVTALPGSPSDGDEVVLMDSLSAPTYRWHLRYNSSSASSYKWEFIGGSPAYAEVATSENVSVTAYGDPSTAGPSITVPRAGEYEIDFNTESVGVSGGTTVARAAPKLGSATAADADSMGGSPGGTAGSAFTRKVIRTLAASDVVKLQYKVDTGTSAFRRRNLAIRPIRVS